MTAEADPDPWRGDVGLGVEAWGATEEVAQRSPRRAGKQPVPAHPEPDPDPEADHEAVARKILLDQLTGQARSRKELADRLAKRNVPGPVATRLLDRFEEVGLIDDQAFARSWVDSRQAGKGLARRALAQELRRKGIDDETARAALDEVDPDDEREAGRALVRKKLRSLSRFDDATKTRRLVGMLARKGFPAGVSYAIVREELGADAADDGDLPDFDL